MKSKKINKNSISVKIWKYFIAFSIGILTFLWFFQVIFLGRYYEWSKTRNLKKLVNEIKEQIEKENYQEVLDQITFEEGICIEVTDQTGKPLYSTDSIKKECLRGGHPAMYKKDFIESNVSSKTYQMLNPMFQNKTLIYGIKIDEHRFLFMNTSLVPIDSTVSILQSQLLYVSIIVILLSFVIAYFISKKISNPIEKMTASAKKLAEGNYDVAFPRVEGIDEINELSSTLNFARDELSKIDELRRDLLANVSHDLKTPLTMIRAYAEMVRDLTYRDPEKREKNLNTIIEEVDRLNLLVDDILSLSVLENKMWEIKYETFDLVKLIQSILERYQIFTATETYQFSFEYPKEPVMIEADRAKIEQVLYNLVNNALNYTGKDNRIYIEILEKKNVYRIQVRDTGKGIHPKDLPHIWEKYYKSDKKHKRNAIGTGLGLSIVKNILKLHHYPYGVESKKDKGTTFFFEISKEKINSQK